MRQLGSECQKGELEGNKLSEKQKSAAIRVISGRKKKEGFPQISGIFADEMVSFILIKGEIG